MNAAIHAMDMTDGPALFFPGHHLQYDAKGRRIGAEDGDGAVAERPAGDRCSRADVATAEAKWKA